MKKYDVIYCDPPWRYSDKARSGKRGVEYKYQTMTPKQLAALQIDRIASDDCVMFMWVTPPMMQTGLDLLRRWSFRYRTIAFTWVKTRSRGKLHWGMGNWTRANAEHVLLGIRGKPKRIDAGVHSVVMSELRKHSEKPPEVRDRIVQLMGDVPRVELFARVKPIGWDAIGIAIDGRDIQHVLGGYENLEMFGEKIDETTRSLGQGGK